MFGTEPQDRQRQPDLVVQVALVAERRHRGAEDRRDRFLRGGLGDRARDPDDQRIEAGPPRACDRLQGAKRVVDQHDRRVATGEVAGSGRTGDEHAGRACRDGRPHELVAVGALARQGDEQVAGLDDPGVDGSAADRSAGSSDEGPAGDRHQLVGGQSGIGIGGRGRRVEAVGHAGHCRIGRAHRVAVVGSAGTGRVPTRSGVVIASWAILRKSSNDMTGISRWPSLAIVGFTSATPAVAATVSAVPPPGNDIGVVAPGATMLAPMPVSESMWIEAFNSRASRRTIDRPRPRPSGLCAP